MAPQCLFAERRHLPRHTQERVVGARHFRDAPSPPLPPHSHRALALHAPLHAPATTSSRAHDLPPSAPCPTARADHTDGLISLQAPYSRTRETWWLTYGSSPTALRPRATHKPAFFAGASRSAGERAAGGIRRLLWHAATATSAGRGARGALERASSQSRRRRASRRAGPRRLRLRHPDPHRECSGLRGRLASRKDLASAAMARAD
mmetsp:Transcript_22975/g.77536  ORF Transcript_22975/g.77536 Transcript_22975/m.77536 type:complete len:206 (+) Transcript_22975:247-864(+)